MGAARACQMGMVNRVVPAEELEAQIRAAQEQGRDAILVRLRNRGQPEVTLPVRLRAAQ